MYKTIKIRLQLSEEQKEHLLKYEAVFHKEINRINILFTTCYLHNFKNIQITNKIEKHTHWILYQIALCKFKQLHMGKKFTYGKSSTWSPYTAKVNKNMLELYYGDDWPFFKHELKMKVEEYQIQLLVESKVIRIDIIHDEKFWFANFLIKINDYNNL